MEHNTSVNISEKPSTTAVAPLEIKARLAVLNQNQFAKELGVGRAYVCDLVAGRKLFSPLMRKLARKIKVPESQLREHLADHTRQRATDRYAT